MGKENLLKVLENKFKTKARLQDTYKGLTEIGIKYAFNHLTDEEKQIAATYVRAVPHAYYFRYFYEMYGVRFYERIDNLTEEIRNLIWEYRKYFYPQYVGPFFYINGKIRGIRMDINDGNITDDFINSPISHFNYANFLHLDDYGHYPRGRVIYNNKTNVFYIYVDKSLLKNEEANEDIKRKFRLSDPNTVIKTDEHYTNDDL